MSATVLQMPLFERRTPRVDRAGIDVHAVALPAREFTGDFYYTHRYEDRLWFAVGDVAGKGLPAAVVMAMIQEELEHRVAACAMTRCDPAATMLRLHTFLRPLLPQNRFATAIIGHMRDDGLLVVANAGHCPLLVAGAAGRIEEIGSTGPVVGILPSPQWTSVTRQIERGSTLLLYSDGLLEAESPDEQELGRGGVRRAFEDALHGRTARDVAAAVVESGKRHAGGKRNHDDLTVVVIRR